MRRRGTPDALSGAMPRIAPIENLVLLALGILHCSRLPERGQRSASVCERSDSQRGTRVLHWNAHPNGGHGRGQCDRRFKSSNWQVVGVPAQSVRRALQGASQGGATILSPCLAALFLCTGCADPTLDPSE